MEKMLFNLSTLYKVQNWFGSFLKEALSRHVIHILFTKMLSDSLTSITILRKFSRWAAYAGSSNSTVSLAQSAGAVEYTDWFSAER